MYKLDVLNLQGESVGTVELPAQVFEVTVNQQLLAQAMHIHRENQRKFTSDTKGRSEVRGGGRKPWRQKGTGRARQGSIRSPQWRGGGVVFGPAAQSQKRLLALPKKMRKAAMCSALTAAAQAENIVIVDQIALDKPSTGAMTKGIGKKLLGKTVLFVGVESTDAFKRSIHNVPSWRFATVNGLGVSHVLSNQVLVLEKSSLEAIATRVAQSGTAADVKTTTDSDAKKAKGKAKAESKSASSSKSATSKTAKPKTTAAKAKSTEDSPEVGSEESK